MLFYLHFKIWILHKILQYHINILLHGCLFVVFNGMLNHVNRSVFICAEQIPLCLLKHQVKHRRTVVRKLYAVVGYFNLYLILPLVGIL